MSSEDHGTDPGHVERWLTERVGHYLDRPAADIDPRTPLAELGMDSVYALVLCGDIEDTYGVSVDATLAWDYPTVAAITEFLSGQLAAPRAGGS
jgi:acyl carrier protein